MNKFNYFFEKQKRRFKIKKECNKVMLDYLKLKTQNPHEKMTQLGFRLLFADLEELERDYVFFNFTFAAGYISNLHYNAVFYCIENNMNDEAVDTSLLRVIKEVVIEKL